MSPRLFIALLVLLIASVANAQTAPALPSTNSVDSKDKDAKTPDSSKPRVSLDQVMSPSGSVTILVEDLKDALERVPKAVLLTPEQYQNLLERINQLERQSKSDKISPYSCLLTGSLDGAVAHLRGEFRVPTTQPGVNVTLGLQGAQFVDVGEFDKGVPTLSYDKEEGYSLHVDKEGDHLLTLRFDVPIGVRNGIQAANGAERYFELGLPGSLITHLNMEMPSSIKEIRINDTRETKSTKGQWQASLGMAKSLTVAWTEAIAQKGTAAFLSADCQMIVKMDETSMMVSAELTLEDPRGQTREWQLLLPPQSKVEVKTSGNLAYELFYPDDKNRTHRLRLAEATREKISVGVQVRMPRLQLGTRLPVGPFVVVNALRQQGTIAVHASDSAYKGQSLYFHRSEELFQRDPPKQSPSADLVALFQYWSLPSGGSVDKGIGTYKAPLELEWKLDRGQVDAKVEHDIHLRAGAEGTNIEVRTHIFVKASNKGTDFVDVQLPRTIPQLQALDVQQPWPAQMDWFHLAALGGRGATPAMPFEVSCEEDELLAPDTQRRARVRRRGALTPEFSVVLVSKYLVPAGARRAQLDLLRPLDVSTRQTILNVFADDGAELVVGPAGNEEPVPERTHYSTTLIGNADSVELAWRASRLQSSAHLLADVALSSHSAKVRQELTWEGRGGHSSSAASQIKLHLPSNVRGFQVVSGGRLNSSEPEKRAAYISVNFDASAPVLVVEYDVAFASPSTDGSFELGLVWPELATFKDAKVRIWSEPGTRPFLTAGPDNHWLDHGTEIVAKHESLPALVLVATGQDLPLYLRLGGVAESNDLPMICEKSLIRVDVSESGEATYHARYRIVKFSSHTLDVAFPAPAFTCLQNVTLDGKRLPWSSAKENRNIAKLQVEPALYTPSVVLEFEYKLPVDNSSRIPALRSIFTPPRFKEDVYTGSSRWQINTPDNWVCIVEGEGTVRDYRWARQGVLWGVEPSATGADLERWFTSRDRADAGRSSGVVFWSPADEPVEIVHLPRQVWLLLCSGLFLVVALGFYLAPIARLNLWIMIAAAVVTVLLLALFYVQWIPLVIFGCEPGVMVFLAVITAQAILTMRHRRKVTYMPSFSRQPVQTISARLPRREASTVDSPLPPSVISQKAEGL